MVSTLAGPWKLARILEAELPAVICRELRIEPFRALLLVDVQEVGVSVSQVSVLDVPLDGPRGFLRRPGLRSAARLMRC